MNLLPSSLSKNDSLSHFFSLNDARVTGQTAETTVNQEFLEFTTGDWAYSRYPVCSCVQQKLMIYRARNDSIHTSVSPSAFSSLIGPQRRRGETLRVNLF
jgi:hypothetical protein